MNTRAILDNGEVVALELAVENRAGLNRGIKHPREINVYAVDRLAGHFQRNISIFLFGTDQRELIRSFDLDLFRMEQLDLRSLCGERAIVGAPSTGGMGNDAVFRSQ